MKRFITNGCGEVLLTLARSEPEITDGRGLSLFLSERSPRFASATWRTSWASTARRPANWSTTTCPAKLIGERQRGLITYVMALMNGARVGIAAQSLGIAEAAYRLGRTYANSRKQFGGPIERLPAVAEMVTDMKIAARGRPALTYETSRVCDLENNNTLRPGVSGCGGRPPASKEELKRRKDLSRTLKRLNGMLTPMGKYYASEMCISVAGDAIQVLGGSGYMKDYPAERYLRDARITTIYEGTSQLQVVAAVRGVCSGAFERRMAEFEEIQYADPLLAELKAKLAAAKEQVLKTIVFVKSQSMDFLDLAGRKLVDAAAAVYIGHLLLQQAAGRGSSPVAAGVSPAVDGRTAQEQWHQALRDRKKRIARRFIEIELAKARLNCELIATGDRTPLEEYALLAGPVPVKE